MEGTEDATPVDPLRQALGEYLRIPGVQAAILVSDKGLMVCGVAHDDVDTTSIAALVTDTMAAAQQFGLQLQAGRLDTMSIEFEKFTFVLAPFTSDVMLALVATPGSLGVLTGVLARGPVPAPATTLAGATERSRDQG